MAEQENRQPTATSELSVTVELKRIRKHKNNRNYPLLQTGKTILQRNFSGISKMIIRNYRKLGN